MNRLETRAASVTVMASLLGGIALVWTIGLSVPPATAQSRENLFTGPPPTSEDATAVRTTRLRFTAGSRSNWHSHSGGQLLMVEQGKARTQERGGPVREIGPGQPWFTKPGVEHWHGASPDTELLQLAVTQGGANWLEPVADKEYTALKR